MTVPSDVSKSGPYFGNGVTTAFNYDFKVVDETHLSVVVRDAVSGTQRTLVLNSDYTVTGVGNSGGGQIITTTAPTSNETLTILRNIPFTQDVDLENQGAYYAETVESALDLMVMRDQQLAEELERSIKLPADADPSLLPIMTEGLHRLYQSVDAIDTVAASVADVETVAASIADVNALGPVASDIADVASIKSHVSAVAENMEAVHEVSDIATEIASLGAIPDAIVGVYDIASDVTTVASIKDDVQAVPGLVQDAQDARDDAVDAKNAAQAAAAAAAGSASAANDAKEDAEAARDQANNIVGNLSGGLAGQFLVKNSNSDYDYGWADISGGGDMPASVYDPNGVAADAFNMDNMVEGSTNLILTAAERAKIAEVDDKVSKAGDEMQGGLAYRHGDAGTNVWMHSYQFGDKPYASIGVDLYNDGSLDFHTFNADTGAWNARALRIGIDGFVTLNANPTQAMHAATKGYVDDNFVSFSQAQTLTPTQQEQARANIGLGNSATRNVGTTAGTVAAGDDPRFRQPLFVNVMDFGAVPDGTTDNSAAFTAALAGGNKTVYVPAGTYYFSQYVRIEKNTHLIFDPGAIINVDATSFLVNGIVGDSNYATGYNGDGNIHIEGGQFYILRTSGAQTAFIQIAHARNILVENCDFKSLWRGHFIEFNAVDDGVIRNCRFTGQQVQAGDSGRAAINLDFSYEVGFPTFGAWDGTRCKHILVEGNFFDGCQTCVDSHGSTQPSEPQYDFIIINNIMRNSGQHAIWGRWWREFMISGNQILSSVDKGILMQDCSQGIIGGNIIKNVATNGDHAVQLQSCQDVIVTPNYVRPGTSKYNYAYRCFGGSGNRIDTSGAIAGAGGVHNVTDGSEVGRPTLSG